MTKTTVMQTAWKIARHGAKTFGGNVKDYFSAALKMAWRAVKQTVKATLTTKMGSRNHKTWVAKLTGANSTYKFNREFINDFREDYPSRVYSLSDGVYDVCDGGDRKYIRVSNGTIETISEPDVAAAI